MSRFEDLRFFATAPHPCSYLEGQEATTLFVDPEIRLTPDDIARLTDSGFRRSGRYTYRPHCQNCQACISVRVCCAEFQPKRRQRRTRYANEDLTFTLSKPTMTERHYGLYVDYINARHRDGDMYPPSIDQYHSFLVTGGENAFFLEAYLDQRLIAVTHFERITGRGLSAIYTFFDPRPELHARSLGRRMILQLIEQALLEKLDYLYLGYWIRDAQKIAYKTEYRPLEMLVNGRWIRAT